MIELGVLFEYVRDDSVVPSVVRVIYVDTAGIDAAVIDVDNKTAQPIWHKVRDLKLSLATSEARVLEIDHAKAPTILEEDLPEKSKQFRNIAWVSIAPLFEGDNAVLMLFPHERSRLIGQRARELNVTEKTLRKRVRRYWQGGQTPNTQLSHYRNCGRNKDRKIIKKLGRPSHLSKAEGRVIGVNIDANWKDTIIRGGILFYEHERTTYEEAYRKTLAHFCKRGYRTDNGVKAAILPPVEEVFTIGQFKYWHQKHAQGRQRQVLNARFTERRVNLRYRESLGSSTKEAFGPGSLFQIDATMGDVYLVSRRNRNQIIGRPIIHCIIDVFTRMVVGISVRPEPEAWLGMNLAIENATVDKVSFCAQHGIVIDKELWPVSCFPERLLGDRGPLEGSNVENLIKNCNVSIENTPPYRADWKGIVEQFFNILNIKLIHQLPAAVYRSRERGERDHRLDAKLDIQEFTQILLKCVLYYNNEHRMDWYDMNEFQIRDEVEPYSSDLFRWGVENRQGLLRTRDPEQVRLTLLPSGTATVTEHGIRFRQLFYVCEEANRHGWYLRARNSGRWNLPVAYDPRRAAVIFLRPEDGSASITCGLRDADSPFRDSDWSEVDRHFENKKVAAQRATTRGLQSDVSLMADIAHIASQAAEKTKLDLISGQSKRSRTRNIREHRREEISAIHHEEADQLYGTHLEPVDRARTDVNETKAVPFPRATNVRQIRERQMNNVKED